MQRCKPVVSCQYLDWNIVIRHKTEQERNVEPCSWISITGSDVTVELNLCAVDDCRSNNDGQSVIDGVVAVTDNR